MTERWRSHVLQLMELARSLAGDDEPAEAHPELELVAGGVGLLGAAMIRLCRQHSTDPLGAIDVAIEGLQQARTLMGRRRPPRGARS